MTRRKAAPISPGSTRTSVVPWVLLALVIVLVVTVRVRLSDVPLERDEGEYAYAGQLILNGVAPYTLAYNMKFPGTYYAYAGIMAVFGETARGIHLGLLLVHLATAVLVFLLGRRWLDPLTGAMAAALFAALALDRWTMGIFAHATHFVLLPALGGFVVLSAATGAPGRWRCVGAGVLFGLAVLMKQPAATYGLLAVLFVAWRCSQGHVAGGEMWRRIAALAAGGTAPLLVIVLVLWAQGVLGRFWFWTFDYASQYATTVPLNEAVLWFQITWEQITKATGSMWLLAAAGAVAFWAGRWSGEAKVFLGMLALASAAAILPGLNFRQHYFILFLPVVALLGAVASTAVGRIAARVVPAAAPIASLAVTAGAIATYVSGESDYLFRMAPQAISRSIYQANPFVEAPEIARYLGENTTPNDRIAVFGSEPEIYFHADRMSATGYIYTYPLMEPQAYAARMQDEMISEVERAEPKYLVRVLIDASWATRPTSHRRIFDWLDRYAERCYEVTGVVDIGERSTTIRWDEDVVGYRPQNSTLVVIYRRVTGPCSAVLP